MLTVVCAYITRYLRNGQVGNTKLVGNDNTGFPSTLVSIDFHVMFTVMSYSKKIVTFYTRGQQVATSRHARNENGVMATLAGIGIARESIGLPKTSIATSPFLI